MKNNRKERRNWRREGRGNATGLCWEKQNLRISARGRAREQRGESRAELGGSGHQDSNPSWTQLRLQPAKQNLPARRSGPRAAGKSTTGQEWSINRASSGVIGRSRSRRASTAEARRTAFLPVPTSPPSAFAATIFGLLMATQRDHGERFLPGGSNEGLAFRSLAYGARSGSPTRKGRAGRRLSPASPFPAPSRCDAARSSAAPQQH